MVSKFGSTRSTSAREWPADVNVTTLGFVAAKDRRRQQGRQQEVTEVVRPELDLEAVDGATERAGHHPGVVDQHVDGLVGLEVGVGERAHARRGRPGRPRRIRRSAPGTAATTSAMAPAARSSLRASTVTVAPWAASARALSRPRPVAAPVMTTRRPARSTPSSTSSVVVLLPKSLIWASLARRSGARSGVVVLDELDAVAVGVVDERDRDRPAVEPRSAPSWTRSPASTALVVGRGAVVDVACRSSRARSRGRSAGRRCSARRAGAGPPPSSAARCASCTSSISVRPCTFSPMMSV